MKVGIVGVGVVGGALASYLKAKGHDLVLDDPPRGINGDCSTADVLFICVPVETVADKRTGREIQDLGILKKVLTKYKIAFREKPVFIRSTLLPKTCDTLAKVYKMPIHSCPEFLTEREADESFREQDLLVGMPNFEDVRAQNELHELLNALFPEKLITIVRNREAELAKYAHNCMGALKVNFFNIISKYAEKIRADYNNVLAGVLLSGYINEVHTHVPGPDGKYGFGGKCFPKDLHALVGELERIGVQCGSLRLALFENFTFRAHRDLDVKAPTIVLPELPKPANAVVEAGKA